MFGAKKVARERDDAGRNRSSMRYGEMRTGLDVLPEARRSRSMTRAPPGCNQIAAGSTTAVGNVEIFCRTL